MKCCRAIVLTVFILAAIFPTPAQAAPQSGILQSVEDFLSLGRNTVLEINRLLQDATGQLREELELLKRQIESLIETLEETYQENLSITIDSLGAEASNRILDLAQLLEDVNEVIQHGVNEIEEAGLTLIQEAADQATLLVPEIEGLIDGTVIRIGEASSVLIDRTADRIVFLIAIAVLGGGLLLLTWMFYTRKLPVERSRRNVVLGLMAVFLAGFGSLLMPVIRGRALAYAGVGVKERLESLDEGLPSITLVRPSTIYLSDTETIEIWGKNLLLEPGTPRVAIGGQAIPVIVQPDPPRHLADRLVAADLSALESTAPGVSQLILSLPDGEELTEVVNLVAPTPTPEPPDLVVERIEFNPSGNVGRTILDRTLPLEAQGDFATLRPDAPMATPLASPKPRANPVDILSLPVGEVTGLETVEGELVLARVHIRNNGSGQAGSFTLRWVPEPGHPGEDKRIEALGPGERVTVDFDHTFQNPGTFQMLASVDSDLEVSETREDNNALLRSILVTSEEELPPQRARVTVHFNQLELQDVPEGPDKGEVWFVFEVNGLTARWPDSGTSHRDDGDTVNPDRSLTVDLVESQDLVLRVNGRESDGGIRGRDDPMGVVEESFGFDQEWGRGQHSRVRSSCPEGCYYVSYEVSWSWLE